MVLCLDRNDTPGRSVGAFIAHRSVLDDELLAGVEDEVEVLGRLNVQLGRRDVAIEHGELLLSASGIGGLNKGLVLVRDCRVRWNNDGSVQVLRWNSIKYVDVWKHICMRHGVSTYWRRRWGGWR